MKCFLPDDTPHTNIHQLVNTHFCSHLCLDNLTFADCSSQHFGKILFFLFALSRLPKAFYAAVSESCVCVCVWELTRAIFIPRFYVWHVSRVKHGRICLSCQCFLHHQPFRCSLFFCLLSRALCGWGVQKKFSCALLPMFFLVWIY